MQEKKKRVETEAHKAWKKANMKKIDYLFKREFVDAYRNKCKDLDIKQTEPIRKAMKEVIEGDYMKLKVKDLENIIDKNKAIQLETDNDSSAYVDFEDIEEEYLDCIVKEISTFTAKNAKGDVKEVRVLIRV